MSDELIAALAGAFVGIIGGIVGNRFVASLGRLWCEPSGWKMKFVGQDGELGVDRATEARYVNYFFDLDLFNGRDMPTGLRNLKVALICPDGELLSEPIDRASRSVERVGGFGEIGGRARVHYEELSVINLPPREWVRKEFRGSFHDLEGVNVSKWNRADLVGEWPRHWRKTFKKTIAKR